MIRLIAAIFAALIIGQVWAGSSPPPIPGNGGRQFIAAEPRSYTPADFGGRMDARQFWAQCTMTEGTAALACGSTTTVTGSTTVNQGERTITIAGSSFGSFALTGSYVSVTGLGANGGTFTSLVLSVLSDTVIVVADPVQTAVSGVSETFTFNSLFNTATDPGKTIYIGMKGLSTNIGSSSTAPYVATITSCSTANACTLSVNATSSIPAGYNDWVLITIGTDDSTACTAAVSAALARGDRFLGVPSNTLIPTCTTQLEWVIPRGEGALYFPPVRRFTVPPDAGPPPPPKPTVFPKLHLPNTDAEITSNGSAVCVVTGDSLNMLNPAITAEGQTLPAAVMKRMDLLSPKVRVYERAVGGFTETQFDATPAGIGVNDSVWGQTTTTPWLGSPAATGYIYALTPSCMFIGFGNNDAQSAPYTDLHIFDYVANIDTWSTPVDILFSLSWPKDLASTAATQDQFDSITMFRRTFAEVNGLGLLDFNKAAIIARDGYDPTRPAMTLFPFIPTNQSTGFLSGQDYAWPVATTGYQSRLLLGSTATNFFAAAVSGTTNGVGEIYWEVGCNLTGGSTCGDNIVRIGIDNTAQGGGNTGNAYVECDADYLHPGTGCRAPVGVVPVVYSQTAVCSMTAASNSLTCTTAQFTTGDETNPIVIAGAGPTMENGFKDYLLCNAHYVSTTNITCFTNSGHGTDANATTTLTSVTMQIGRGNPHIVSSISLSSDETANPTIGITVNGDFFDLWYDDPNEPLIYGHVIRFGGNFQPHVYWTGAAGSGSNRLYFQAGGYQFIETPYTKMFTPLLTSFEVNGPPEEYGDAIAGPVSSYSGAADNHPTTLFGATVINPVVDAQNLCATCQ